MLKKLLTITAASVVAIFAATAQNAIPNAGFETWSGGNPTGWATINLFANGSATQATTAGDYHGGSSAVALTTKSSLFGNAPGVIATGTLNIATTSFTGGIPFNLRPDSLTGWFKYAPVGTDTAFFSAFLFKRNGSVRDTVAKAVFTTSATVNSYTYFKTEFVYLLGVTPDSAQFIMTSGGPGGGNINTKAWLDDLGLVYNPSVGVNDLSAENKISVYPNPVIDNLYINMAGTQDANVSIFDITGKKISQQVLSEKVNTINITTLAKGMYVYQISNAAKAALKTGKFIVK